MKIVTAFIFYFLIAVVALSFSLVIFTLKPFRRLLHKIQTKYKHILNNGIVNAVVYFSFAIIAIILLESLYSFYKMHSHLFSNSNILREEGLENLDLVQGHHNHNLEDTIISLREFKEYYMSERNIMLTSSAFFAYFILSRLFFNIRKLADLENQIAHPEEKSVIDEEKKSDGKLKAQ